MPRSFLKITAKGTQFLKGYSLSTVNNRYEIVSERTKNGLSDMKKYRLEKIFRLVNNRAFVCAPKQRKICAANQNSSTVALFDDDN